MERKAAQQGQENRVSLHAAGFFPIKGLLYLQKQIMTLTSTAAESCVERRCCARLQGLGFTTLGFGF